MSDERPSSPGEPSDPAARSHAGSSATPTKPVASPLGPLRLACWCSLIAFAAVPVILILPLAAQLCAVPAGFVIAVVGFGAALTAAARNRAGELPSSQKRPRRTIIGAKLLTGAIVLIYLILAVALLGVLRGQGMAAVPRVDLQGLGRGLLMYETDHGVPPRSWDDLVEAELTTPLGLISPVDRHARSKQPPYYSSFVYTPGVSVRQVEPLVIWAYERTPMTWLTRRMFDSGVGRCVLFGDGHVEILDEAAFQAALAKDHARRQALGWPPIATP